jgi:hypothetical protein
LKGDTKVVKKGRLVRGSTKVFKDLGLKEKSEPLELGIGKSLDLGIGKSNSVSPNNNNPKNAPIRH